MPRSSLPFRSLVVVWAGVLLVSLSSPGLSAKKGGKHEKSGRPDMSRGGLYFWQENGAWRLAAHTKEKRHVFTGTIKVKGAKFVEVRLSELEKGDIFRMNGPRDTIAFRLTAKGKTDHIDLPLDGKAESITVEVKEDGSPNVDRVYVGRKGKNPSSSKFVLNDD